MIGAMASEQNVWHNTALGRPRSAPCLQALHPRSDKIEDHKDPLTLDAN